MPRTKSSETPALPADMPVLPTKAAWIGGVLIDLGDRNEAEVRAERKAEQLAKQLEWQKQSGFAEKAAQMEAEGREVAAQAAREATAEAKKAPKLPKLNPAVVTAPAAPEVPARPVYREPGVRDRIAQWMADSSVRMYDHKYGTSFMEALEEKRADDRNLQFATSIGLISLEDVTCRKHEHAVAEMRGLAE